MISTTEGLQDKYIVYKSNGPDYQGPSHIEPVSDRVFVLRPEQDPISAAALLMYADVVSAMTGGESPLLAEVEVWLQGECNPDKPGETMYQAGVRLYNQVLDGICPPA